MLQWITTSDGQRFVYLKDPDDDPDDAIVRKPSAFTVCDFNPYNVRRFWMRPEEANARRLLVTDESILEDMDFEQPVRSSLPYIVCTTERDDYKYDGVLMEEERLVGITVRGISALIVDLDLTLWLLVGFERAYLVVRCYVSWLVGCDCRVHFR